jgi:hypothetical protein
MSRKVPAVFATDSEDDGHTGSDRAGGSIDNVVYVPSQDSRSVHLDGDVSTREVMDDGNHDYGGSATSTGYSEGLHRVWNHSGGSCQGSRPDWHAPKKDKREDF